MVGFRSKKTKTGYHPIADERNFLFEHMVAAALELRPRLFLMENVPGMHSVKRENLSFLEAAAAMLSKKGGYPTRLLDRRMQRTRESGWHEMVRPRCGRHLHGALLVSAEPQWKRSNSRAHVEVSLPRALAAASRRFRSRTVRRIRSSATRRCDSGSFGRPIAIRMM